MNLPVEVIDATRAGRCVLFLGSRATSEAAELADAPWVDASELAKELGWRKPKPVPGQKPKVVVPSVMEGAAAFEAAHGRAALVARVAERRGATGLAPTDAHSLAFRRYPVIFTTTVDDLVDRAADAAGLPVDRVGRGERIPDADPTRRVVVRLRGELGRPDTLALTPADLAARPATAEDRRQMRTILRNNVVFFVGYRPDEEEFERLFEELSDAYGGELPRCHMAVAQGSMDDYLWQKWVWRGLLLFTADPAECLLALDRALV